VTKHRLLCAGGLLLALAAGLSLLLPGVRWGLWGLWRGEAFYRGRPTSAWRESVAAFLAEHRA
jgi:hypothetical protein